MGLSAQEANGFDGQSYPSGKMGVEAVLPQVIGPSSFGLKCVMGRAWKTLFHLWPCCLELYKIFASTALRLGLLIKNQKREVRRKYA